MAVSGGEFQIPSDFSSVLVKVLQGTDLFAPIENGLQDLKSSRLCLDLSSLYGGSVHSSFSSVDISYAEGLISFDSEEYMFDSIKPEYHLRISLIGLRNYTTGYGLSPQILGVVDIPVERLNEGTITQWYPFYAPNGVTSLRSAIKLEIIYTRKIVYFANCVDSAPKSEAIKEVTDSADNVCGPLHFSGADMSRAPITESSLRRRSFTNFGRSQSAFRDSDTSQDDSSEEKYDRMPVGLADYFVIVGPISAAVNPESTDQKEDPFVLNQGGDVAIWDRFPRNDYPDGPMPPKVEWFCFPDGAIFQWSTDRPEPRLSSFIMLAGDSRQYGVTLIFYINAAMSRGARPPTEAVDLQSPDDPKHQWWKGKHAAGHQNLDSMEGTKKMTCWMGVCMCFLTRAPFVQQLSVCLTKLFVADILPNLNDWETGFLQEKKSRLFKYTPFYIESSFLLVSLCLDCPLPIPELFHVNLKLPDKYNSEIITNHLNSYFPPVFSSQGIAPVSCGNSNGSISAISPFPENGDVVFNLVSNTTLYKCQFSLEEFFLLFGVRGGVDLVHCAILEQKILFHSRDFSVLPMVCECVRTLMYPLSCCCVYIPVVPSTLLDLVEAPVPYILGVHSDWLGLFKDEVLLDVLVCDCNTGGISVGKVGPELRSLGIPSFPEKMDRWLVMGLKYALGYLDAGTLFGLASHPEEYYRAFNSERDVQSIIQLLFMDTLSCFFSGLPECLIFLDSEFPVFNKSLFFREFTHRSDRDFVSLLVETQSFDRLISTIQTPNLTFFCMGMERRGMPLESINCNQCKSSGPDRREQFSLSRRPFPSWVYSRLDYSVLEDMSTRYIGEFDTMRLLVESRLNLYGYSWDGTIMQNNTEVQASGCISLGDNRKELDVIISDVPKLDRRRGFRDGQRGVNKVSSRKSRFIEGFFGRNESKTTTPNNYDIAKTIEKNLQMKKSRRGCIISPNSFDGNDVGGVTSFEHFGSFAENEKLWAMEDNSLDSARYRTGSSFRDSFVGGEQIVDPPVRFSKSTFQAALKSSENVWSVSDVSTALNVPQERIISAFEQKSAGKGNLALRGSFVEGGTGQRAAIDMLSVIDADPNVNLTDEGKCIIKMLKAIHSGKVSSSFSHSTTMALLQESTFAMNFQSGRKKLLELLLNSERGTYGSSNDKIGTNGAGISRFIQVDFEGYEVLVTLCYFFLSSCLRMKDHISVYSLLESVQYYFRVATAIGSGRKAKLGQTYVSFTRRSIFENSVMNDLNVGSDDVDSDSDSSLPLEILDEDIKEDDAVTGEMYTALRLEAYDLADTKRAILKEVQSSSFKDGDSDEGGRRIGKKSVSFVPLEPNRSQSASLREGIVSQLSGHPIFQVLEFWQDIAEIEWTKLKGTVDTSKKIGVKLESNNDQSLIRKEILHVCEKILNEIHIFGLSGDLGAVCIQAIALKWKISLEDYKSLLLHVCKIWEVQAQLQNIDRAFQAWNNGAEETGCDDVKNKDHVKISPEVSSVGCVNFEAATDRAIEIYGALENGYAVRPLERRHSINDIYYDIKEPKYRDRKILHQGVEVGWNEIKCRGSKNIFLGKLPELGNQEEAKSSGRGTVSNERARRHSLAGGEAVAGRMVNKHIKNGDISIDSSNKLSLTPSDIKISRKDSLESFSSNSVFSEPMDKSDGNYSVSSDTDIIIPSAEDCLSTLCENSIGAIVDKVQETCVNPKEIFGRSHRTASSGNLSCLSLEEKNDQFPSFGTEQDKVAENLSLGIEISTSFDDTELGDRDTTQLLSFPSPLLLMDKTSTRAPLSLGGLSPKVTSAEISGTGSKGSVSSPESKINGDSQPSNRRSISVPVKMAFPRTRPQFIRVPVEVGTVNPAEITALDSYDRWLVSGDTSGNIHVLDMKIGKVVESKDHPDSIMSIVCLPEMGGYLTCCRSGVINLWNYPRIQSEEMDSKKRGSMSRTISPITGRSMESKSSLNGGNASLETHDHHDEPSTSRWGLITGLRRSKVATLKLSPIRVTAFATNTAHFVNYGVFSSSLLCAVGGSNGELRVFQKNSTGFVEIFHHNEYNPNGMSSKHICCLYLSESVHRKTPRRPGQKNADQKSSESLPPSTRSGMLAKMRTARSGSMLADPGRSSGEKYLVVGSISGVVECWDVATQECVFSTALSHAAGHVGKVTSLILLEDRSGKLPSLIFSGGNDRTARLYDFRSKKCCLVIKSASGPITSVCGGFHGAAFRLLYVASSDGAIRCYSLKNGEVVRLVREYMGHSDRIMSMELETLHNEEVLRTCSRDGTVRIWETGFAHVDEENSSSVQNRHITVINTPIEASIVLRPSKVPFIAINACTSSTAKLIATSPTASQDNPASQKNKEVKAIYMASGMSDGSLSVWKAHV